MAVEVPVKKLRYYWPVYLLIAIPLLLVIVSTSSIAGTAIPWKSSSEWGTSSG